MRWLRAAERLWNPQGVGRDLARLERICRTPETNASSMKWGMLRLLACRRRCRVIRACAVDTHDGEVESEATSDLRSWTGTQIYAHGIVCRGAASSVRYVVRRRLRDAVAYIDASPEAIARLGATRRA